MPIVKSTGVTRTEKLLAELCERSFLKLWSYPNPFKEDRDELCDLLAVFENHVFIFFDRENRQLEDPEKDPVVAWGRWKKNTIDAQTRTAHGAERYLRSGRKIYLDNKLAAEFPLDFDRSNMIVHRIIVAHGAKKACQKFSDENIYGSLAIAYGEPDQENDMPFFVEVDKNNPVHIFDSHNLPIIFDELDTVFDFSTYLDEKIEAIQSLDGLVYCGEEDLLAHYFTNFDKAKNRHVIAPGREGVNAVSISEGQWSGFIKLAPYKRKKEADKISYFWDELIQRTCDNALKGTLLGDANVLQGNSAIHEMAKEPRFLRRALSQHMIDAIRNFPETKQPIVRNISFMPSFYRDKGYVFLQLKCSEILDYEREYRPRRQALLEIACGAARNNFPHLNKVIGIAIDAPKFSRRNSEDFILMDCSVWPEERRAHYEEANRLTNFFKCDSLTRYEKKNAEFPTVKEGRASVSRPREIGRNDPCYCGSGKKFKKCCDQAQR